jgi:hypothetical protein
MTITMPILTSIPINGNKVAMNRIKRIFRSCISSLTSAKSFPFILRTDECLDQTNAGNVFPANSIESIQLLQDVHDSGPMTCHEKDNDTEGDHSTGMTINARRLSVTNMRIKLPASIMEHEFPIRSETCTMR